MTVLAFALLFIFGSNGNTELSPGDTAPDFRLKDSNGTLHTLEGYRGKTVALYFYPKDDTPGCTKQACSLRDGFSALTAEGIIVLGVSYDDSSSHAKFTEKYNLPFPLLSDADKDVSKAYNTYGLLMPKRHTYIINGEGKIQAIIKKVDTTNHADQILTAIKESK